MTARPSADPVALTGAPTADRAAADRALSSSPLLHGIRLNPAHLYLHRVARGDTLEDRMGSTPCATLVARGSVDVYSVAVDGHEVRLSSLAPGGVFGICNLFAAHDLPTVLRSRNDALLVRIPKPLLARAVEEDPAVNRRYLELCNEKIQFLIGRIEELTMQTTRDKLLDYLVLHADDSGLVHLSESREELAAYLGVSRAALYRELTILKTSGKLVSVGRDLRICGEPPASAVAGQ